jgi:hypothetical protein
MKMHYDGVRAEDYFEKFCKSNKLSVKRVHKPFDFIVNGKHVEVKSARLHRSCNGKIVKGRYECWNESQLKSLKENSVWLCLIISNKNGFLIQGFCKSKDYPKKKLVSFSAIENKKLKSTKEFLSCIRKSKSI